MPIGGGVNLGNAQGRISIDTSDLNNVRVASQRAGQEVERNLGRIGVGARQAQLGIEALAGAFGVGLGAAGIARFAVQSDALATAFRRQEVAARSLAGSQERLNELLETYDRVTGGTIDKATALADVTRLQAIGFADTAAELERFATAARGISLALGSSQDFIIGQLQLAIANQSTLRLDQLGLGVSEVKQRIDQLKASNKGLSDEMAYQQAILDLAIQKYGSLAKSAEANATGVEKLNKSLKDLRLELGEAASGPVSFIADAMRNWLQDAQRDIGLVISAVQTLKGELQSLGILPGPGPSFARGSIGQGAARARSSGGGVAAPRFTEEQTTLIRDWADSRNRIEREANAASLEANRQYGEQRASIERQYQTTVSREAEDFARQRARAEADFAEQIADIRQDAAKREARQAENLARQIAEARAGSEKRVAEAREDANERLVELEEDYNRNRERAARSHRERLLNAAARLDAQAVFEEQRRFAEESKNAEEAHKEQVDDLQKQLQERLDDERENLDDRIKQAQEAHDRQLRDAREADAERLADMQEDFEERKRLEDEDRVIRLQRMAEDHASQLAEMERQHALNLEQISRQAAEERAQLDEEFRKALAELDIQTDAWIARQKRITDAAIAEFDRFWGRLAENMMAMQGPSPRHPLITPGEFPRLTPQYNPLPGWERSRTSGSVNFNGDVSVSIMGSTNMGRDELKNIAVEAMTEALERMAFA